MILPACYMVVCQNDLHQRQGPCLHATSERAVMLLPGFLLGVLDTSPAGRGGWRWHDISGGDLRCAAQEGAGEADPLVIQAMLEPQVLARHMCTPRQPVVCNACTARSQPTEQEHADPAGCTGAAPHASSKLLGIRPSSTCHSLGATSSRPAATHVCYGCGVQELLERGVHPTVVSDSFNKAVMKACEVRPASLCPAQAEAPSRRSWQPHSWQPHLALVPASQHQQPSDERTCCKQCCWSGAHFSHLMTCCSLSNACLQPACASSMCQPAVSSSDVQLFYQRHTKHGAMLMIPADPGVHRHPRQPR